MRPCIRCGKRHANLPTAEQVKTVPFARFYCGECLKVRQTERIASGVNTAPITEQR